MPQDRMTIEITEAGLFKIETDGISQANHGSAEVLLRVMLEKAGGKPSRTLRPQADLRAALHSHAADGHTHAGGGH